MHSIPHQAMSLRSYAHIVCYQGIHSLTCINVYPYVNGNFAKWDFTLNTLREHMQCLLRHYF